MISAENTREKFLTLSQVSGGIREAIDLKFGDRPLWIVAEISEMSIRKGHCFLSLVEKLPDSAAPLCELKGIVWASRFEKIRAVFLQVTGIELGAQTRILFQARVRYDVKWGLSLVVEDIEPAFTAGLLKRERDQNVARLKAEGVYDNNRKLPFPLVPARIAVISASDSRGFEDFSNKLQYNPFGYVFRLKLFSSLLQGDQAPVQMVARLIEIFDKRHDFDLVVIVRGGGGAIDLNCFNDYRLSRAVARFPLPVITGIGHTTNISIVDEVAHADRITPTDAADFIVEQTRLFEERLYATGLRIRDACMEISVHEEGRLAEAATGLKAFTGRIAESEQTRQQRLFRTFSHELSRRLDQAQLSLFLKVRDLDKKCRDVLSDGSGALAAAAARLRSTPGNMISREMMRVDHFGNAVSMLDPAHVLRRGYSITRFNGRALYKSGALKPGDKIQTQLYEGTIESEVRDAG